jgi:hypothetical protein
MASLRALNPLMRSTRPSEAQEKQVLKTYINALEGGSAFTRFTVLSALSNLGPKASAALPVLEKMSRDEPNESLRHAAKRTADEIRAKSNQAATSNKPQA